MKFARLSALAFALSALLTARAEDTSLKVQASRALSLAIVDLDRNNTASEPLHEAFKDSLSFEMSQRCKSPTPIKPTRVDASRAGWGLGTGLYDVAVVMGGNLPKAMMSSEYQVLKAVPESGNVKRTITLVMRKSDPGLSKLLSESFPDVVKGPIVLKALMRYSGAPEAPEPGLKVAGIGN